MIDYIKQICRIHRKKRTYQWILLILILVSCTPKEAVEILTQPPAKEVNYAHRRWGTTVETFPWSSPGHPAGTIIDGDIHTERGWRHFDDIREGITRKILNVYPDLLEQAEIGWARARRQHAPYIELHFGEKRPLNKVVIYTIDSVQYPAKEYGIRAYRLYFMNEFGRWMLLAKEDNNSKGRIEHTFPKIHTEAIKLQILETNDVAALRRDKEWEIRKIGRKLMKEHGSSGFRSSDKVRSLLQQLPCPLRYISTVIEIEAYGPLDASAEIPPLEGKETEFLRETRFLLPGKWQIYKADKTDGIESDYVWTVEVDGNYIWFGSSCGLLCYDKEKDKWTTYRIPFRPNDSQSILALAVEKDRIWVGTSSQFYTLVDQFYGYTEQKAKSDKSEMEELLTRWAMWTTEQTDGIYTLDKETKKWTVVEEGISNVISFGKFRNKIIAYRCGGKPLTYEADFPEYLLEEERYPEEEEFWKWVLAIGGFHLRVLRYYSQDVPKSMAANLPGDLVRHSANDSYYVVIPIGFSALLYVPPQFTFHASIGPGITVANVLHDSHKVSWWYSYSRRYLEADGLSNQNIQDMVNDGDYVWMATVDGVSRLDLLTDTWERFNVKDGLPHRFATCVAVDEDSVWVGTRQGIARYRKIFLPEEGNFQK